MRSQVRRGEKKQSGFPEFKTEISSISLIGWIASIGSISSIWQIIFKQQIETSNALACSNLTILRNKIRLWLILRIVVWGVVCKITTHSLITIYSLIWILSNLSDQIKGLEYHDWLITWQYRIPHSKHFLGRCKLFLCVVLWRTEKYRIVILFGMTNLEFYFLSDGQKISFYRLNSFC